ncbi:hypothetical protein AMJ52_02320 [candidate division TA06 bacterium DG_78]|uniref:DUF3788 domain-containing protein n=1 Tax=candidate division TA06 bacterium DG_78 TaxID=1703772 RepID=A0A0S7YIH4_UNCT6|nr:MAG: hypothetical protein AMJ52_02320 [candidate division TA06 bacterium DG_78]
MSIGIFTDKTAKPMVGELLKSLGAKRELWNGLVKFVSDNYRVQGEFKYYGKKYGWALCFTKSGRALITLYPGRKGFTAQVVIGSKIDNKVKGLNLGRNVKLVYKSAHMLHDGRWLFIKVKTKKDIKDIQQLLVLKAKPTIVKNMH